MSEERKKTNIGLVILVIFLVAVILGLGGYIIWDHNFANSGEKIEINSNDKDSESEKDIIVEDNTNVEEKNNNDEKISNNVSSEIYVSDDENYVLVLGYYKYNNYAKGRGEESRTFVMTMFGGNFIESFSGNYSIENGKLNLIVGNGCLSINRQFNCSLLKDATIINRDASAPVVSLDYSDGSIKFGSISLLKK